MVRGLGGRLVERVVLGMRGEGMGGARMAGVEVRTGRAGSGQCINSGDAKIGECRYVLIRSTAAHNPLRPRPHPTCLTAH